MALETITTIARWLGAISMFSGNVLAMENHAGIYPRLNTRPNIVFIFTDDQDLHLNSLDYMGTVQSELIAKGTSFSNHFATVALCCPSRASLLRGQMAHNTNITSVSAPGGGYDKWIASGENLDYLPHWLGAAGYRTEYIGKIMNNYNVINYNETPAGWDHFDGLVDPYTYLFNNVVMSENGATPVWYEGYHQTDVIKAKALARLEYLTNADQPFYLTISPTAPHLETFDDLPAPQTRYQDLFQNVTAPRTPAYNPDDSIQTNKVSWIKGLPTMNSTVVDYNDEIYRRRLRLLQGVDEIVEDVVKLLDKSGQLNNTYIIFSSDNGYHIGQYRLPAGKTLPYLTDTNLPFIVRGPGVPAGVKSDFPSAHLDLPPTFLEIAGLPREQWPTFLDGKSLLSSWKNPSNSTCAGEGTSKEILNVEFWGNAVLESQAVGPSVDANNNSYKTLRMVGQRSAYLYSKWCTGEVELYNTTADPYELYNLANSSDPGVIRVLNRLNGILMVTKSCAQDTCRDPWSVLTPGNGTVLTSLTQALSPAYDSYFESLPQVTFQECMTYQDYNNEAPFFPPTATLGQEYRSSTDNFNSSNPSETLVPGNTENQGGWSQRYVNLTTILKTARNLTVEELTY